MHVFAVVPGLNVKKREGMYWPPLLWSAIVLRGYRRCLIKFCQLFALTNLKVPSIVNTECFEKRTNAHHPSLFASAVWKKIYKRNLSISWQPPRTEWREGPWHFYTHTSVHSNLSRIWEGISFQDRFIVSHTGIVSLITRGCSFDQSGRSGFC